MPEIARIAAMGVEIKLNSKVTDVATTMKDGKFDACFLAAGLQNGRMVDIPQKDSLPVLDAVTVLRAVELEEPIALSGRVVVYGGGNTAIDVARSAVRLGALSVTVIVRESREQMPAHHAEISEGIEEGIAVVDLRQITGIDGKTLTLETMVPGEGRELLRTGQTETIEADVVVQALGQTSDCAAFAGLPGLIVADSTVQVGTDMMTGAVGVFAGGDMIPSARSVTAAIGLGKKAARNIDAFLRGEKYAPRPKAEIAGIMYQTHTAIYSMTWARFFQLQTAPAAGFLLDI